MSKQPPPSVEAPAAAPLEREERAWFSWRALAAGFVVGFIATCAVAGVLAAPPGPAPGIPHVIHQTYSSRDALSAEHVAMVSSWEAQNPGFEMRFYDDAACGAYVEESFPEYLSAYNAMELPVQKADLFRYLVVLGDGGVYADIDVEARAPIAPLLDGHSLVVGDDSPKDAASVGQGYVRPEQLQQYVFAAAPGHPAVKAAADKAAACALGECAAKAWGEPTHDVLERSGPGVFTDAVLDFAAAAAEWGKPAVLPKQVLSMTGLGSVGGPAAEDTVAVHHYDGSWRSPEARANLRKLLAPYRALLNGHMGEDGHDGHDGHDNNEEDLDHILEMMDGLMDVGAYMYMPEMPELTDECAECIIFAEGGETTVTEEWCMEYCPLPTEEEVAEFGYDLQGAIEVTDEVMDDILTYFSELLGVESDDVEIVSIEYVVESTVELEGIAEEDFEEYKPSIKSSFATSSGVPESAVEVALKSDTRRLRSLLEDALEVDVTITTNDTEVASEASESITESVDDGSFADTLEEQIEEDTGDSVEIVSTVTEEPVTTTEITVEANVANSTANVTEIQEQQETTVMTLATPTPSPSPSPSPSVSMDLDAMCDAICDDECDDECEGTYELDSCDSEYTDMGCSCEATCVIAGWFIGVIVAIIIVVVGGIVIIFCMCCKKKKVGPN